LPGVGFALLIERRASEDSGAYRIASRLKRVDAALIDI
jgi:hypothetical protein